MKTRLFLILGMVALLSPVLALAQSTCATPTVVPPNGEPTNFDFVAPASFNVYQFDVKPNRSYSVTVKQNYDAVNTDLTVAITTDGSACSAAVTGTTDTSAAEPPLPANAFRVSFTTPGSVASPSYRIKVTNANGSTGRYIEVMVAETTYFSPAWSTNATYDTYYAFLNTTSQSISGNLTLVPSSGAPVSLPITIAAGALNSSNTVSLAAPRNKTGYAFFTHNGPPGALIVTATVANFTSTPAYIQPVDFKGVRDK